jgi:hypothetical protein
VPAGGKLEIASHCAPGSPAEGVANSFQHHQDPAVDGTVAAVTSLLTSSIPDLTKHNPRFSPIKHERCSLRKGLDPDSSRFNMD